MYGIVLNLLSSIMLINLVIWLQFQSLHFYLWLYAIRLQAEIGIVDECLYLRVSQVKQNVRRDESKYWFLIATGKSVSMDIIHQRVFSSLGYDLR